MQSIAKYFVAFLLLLFSQVIHSVPDEDTDPSDQKGNPLADCYTMVPRHIGTAVTTEDFSEEVTYDRNSGSLLSFNDCSDYFNASRGWLPCPGNSTSLMNCTSPLLTDNYVDPSSIRGS